MDSRRRRRVRDDHAGPAGGVRRAKGPNAPVDYFGGFVPPGTTVLTSALLASLVGYTNDHATDVVVHGAPAQFARVAQLINEARRAHSALDAANQTEGDEPDDGSTLIYQPFRDALAVSHVPAQHTAPATVHFPPTSPVLALLEKRSSLSHGRVGGMPPAKEAMPEGPPAAVPKEDDDVGVIHLHGVIVSAPAEPPHSSAASSFSAVNEPPMIFTSARCFGIQFFGMLPEAAALAAPPPSSSAHAAQQKDPVPPLWWNVCSCSFRFPEHVSPVTVHIRISMNPRRLLAEYPTVMNDMLQGASSVPMALTRRPLTSAIPGSGDVVHHACNIAGALVYDSLCSYAVAQVLSSAMMQLSSRFSRSSAKLGEITTRLTQLHAAQLQFTALHQRRVDAVTAAWTEDDEFLTREEIQMRVPARVEQLHTLREQQRRDDAAIRDVIASARASLCTETQFEKLRADGSNQWAFALLDPRGTGMLPTTILRRHLLYRQALAADDKVLRMMTSAKEVVASLTAGSAAIEGLFSPSVSHSIASSSGESAVGSTGAARAAHNCYMFTLAEAEAVLEVVLGKRKRIVVGGASYVPYVLEAYRPRD